MAKLELHCVLCGMPAITLLKGTAVCNNERCQMAAGLEELRLDQLSPSPPSPLENKHHTGMGTKRVPGPNEVAVLQGELRKGATDVEVYVPDSNQIVRICTADEIFRVVEFLRDNFPNEWLEILRSRKYGDVE